MSTRFGYSSVQPRKKEIRFPLPSLYVDILCQEPSLKLCIHCGTCSSVCVANRIQETRFHKIPIMLRYGMTEESLTYARRCLLCGTCILTCPRNVNIRHVMFLLKQWDYEHSL
ncbi:MAG: 4Fe-4S dicluster domain-containing protein [Bacteroidales bacterium]|nr:4Fe-4S dicluster domain-containing protein [Bacteroidales bacterium]